MSNVQNAGRIFVRGLTLSAIAVAFVVAAQSSAQVVCQKTNGNGKAKFKIREACKVEKGETQIASFGDLVQRNETDDLVEQLAGDIADQIAAVSAEIDAVPRTQVIRGNTFAATVGTDLEQVGQTLEFETFAESTNVSITVDGDCGISTPTIGDRMHIDIEVDGAVISPTIGAADTFCASYFGQNTVVATSGSRTVVAEDLPAGVHTIVVSAQMNAGAAFLTDGSLSVVVSENELE
ncbi:MAG: hypothetical protein ACR2PQ_12890 [Myxococcota bacterium]